jgi:hypothetical protein
LRWRWVTHNTIEWIEAMPLVRLTLFKVCVIGQYMEYP